MVTMLAAEGTWTDSSEKEHFGKLEMNGFFRKSLERKIDSEEAHVQGVRPLPSPIPPSWDSRPIGDLILTDLLCASSEDDLNVADKNESMELPEDQIHQQSPYPGKMIDILLKANFMKLQSTSMDGDKKATLGPALSSFMGLRGK